MNASITTLVQLKALVCTLCFTGNPLWCVFILEISFCQYFVIESNLKNLGLNEASFRDRPYYFELGEES